MTDRAAHAPSPWLTLVAGAAALAVVMGIGRFGYTPALPSMQAGTGLDDAMAGIVASANYLGYVAGALAAGYLPAGLDRTTVFRLLMVLGIASLALVATTESLAAWSVLRAVSGVSSGMVFVLAADFVARRMAAIGRPDLMGVHFAGVGIGIALAGALAPFADAFGGWRAQWIGFAVLGAVLACLPLLVLREGEPPASGAPASDGTEPAHVTVTPRLGWLLAAYFLEGLGYIVTGTFLVTVLERSTGTLEAGAAAWIAVGLAGAPATVLVAWLGSRLGLLPLLIASHTVQAMAIILPVLSPSPVAGVISGLFFGATFIGITALSIALGRELRPDAAGRVTGQLTAAFGAGQVIGPIIAGIMAKATGSFDLPLVAAAGAVALGGILLAAGPVVTPAGRSTRERGKF